MEPSVIIKTMQEGMGSNLGFVAAVVGLGAMFGAILKHSGGVESLATFLLSKFGEKRSSWVLILTGFIVAIVCGLFFCKIHSKKNSCQCSRITN